MDNPKVYIGALLVSLAMLLALLLVNSSNSQVITAQVVASTLTQSLDGQRQFITLNMSDGQKHVLTVPLTARCVVNQNAQLERSSDLFGRTSYRLISCQ